VLDHDVLPDLQETSRYQGQHLRSSGEGTQRSRENGFGFTFSILQGKRDYRRYIYLNLEHIAQQSKLTSLMYNLQRIVTSTWVKKQ
jgi:hypothetical protein